MAKIKASEIKVGDTLSHLKVRKVIPKDGKVLVYFEGFERPDVFYKNEFVNKK